MDDDTQNKINITLINFIQEYITQSLHAHERIVYHEEIVKMNIKFIRDYKAQLLNEPYVSSDSDDE